MQGFKKKLRLIGYVLLMVLASIGLGLSGGVPLRSTQKEIKVETKIEMLSSEKKDEEETEVGSFQLKARN